MKNKNRFAIITLTVAHLFLASLAEAATYFSQPVLERQAIYGGGNHADNFGLNSPATISKIRFWGGYSTAWPTPPANEAFSVGFYEDNGANAPKNAPFKEFQNLNGVRTLTGFKTWPGGNVYVYELNLPQAVDLKPATKYYLAVNNILSGWGWSGAGVGGFWYQKPDMSWQDSAPNSYNLAFELVGDANPVVTKNWIGCPVKSYYDINAGPKLSVSWTVTGQGAVIAFQATRMVLGGGKGMMTPAQLAQWKPYLDELRDASIKRVKVQVYYDDASKSILAIDTLYNTPC